MIPLAAAVTTALALLFLATHRRSWGANPAWLFVCTHTIVLIGSIPLLDEHSPPDLVYGLIICAGIVLFLSGVYAGRLMFPVPRGALTQWLATPAVLPRPSAAVFVVLGVVASLSLVVTVLYYRAVGYNLFISGIVRSITQSGSSMDVATMRLEAYAGQRYFAPGYVNQFKNILLPAATAYLVLYAVARRSRWAGYSAALLIPAVVVALLGTGQRGPFVMAGLMGAAFWRIALPTRVGKTAYRVLMTVGVIALVVATANLGRRTTSIQSLEDVGLVVGELSDRVLESNQLSGVVGFRYVYGRPIQNGAEWLQGIAGLLPGNRGSTLSNEVFAVLYGGRRGTSPITLWGSIWYNFGVAGIVVIPLLMGITYQFLLWRTVRTRKTLGRSLSVAGVAVLAGTWFVAGPATLANNGLVAIVLFGVLLRSSERVQLKRMAGDTRSRDLDVGGAERHSVPIEGT